MMWRVCSWAFVRRSEVGWYIPVWLALSKVPNVRHRRKMMERARQAVRMLVVGFFVIDMVEMRA